MLDATGVRGVRGRSGEAGGRSDSSDLDWRVLYETYAPLVRHHAARLVDASLVDDIVQETFLRAYRNRRSIRPDRPLGPWFSVIARRAAIDVVRRGVVHDRVTGAVPVAPVPLEPIEDDYFNAVRRDGIRRVFAELNDRHRYVLARAVLESEPGGTERHALDDTSRSVLARARRGFRERYVDLSRQTGVFGGAATQGRRRVASVREALLRTETWLQTGMPVLIAACASVSLFGSSPSSGAATSRNANYSYTDDAGAVFGRHIGEAVGSFATPALGSEHDALSKTAAAKSVGVDGAPSAPHGAKTSVDWHAGREGDSADIHVYIRTQTMHGDIHTHAGTGIDCGTDSITAAILCGTWDIVPRDRRRYEAGIDNYGAGANLPR